MKQSKVRFVFAFGIRSKSYFCKMTVAHEFHMQQALHLAQKGWPFVAPNPMVGCVIVKNEEVVSTGYHTAFGQPHAEVMAIANLPADLPPADCELYVTLEPCSHFGKTPPCADLIIRKGFKKVIVACQDPNPVVSGQGIQKLRDAGIEVVTGVLEQQALELNKRFVTFFKKKRPFYILKWAQTADGFISRMPPFDKENNKISGPESQQLVHQWRSEVMGIMVGKNTVLNDNPHLTTRLVAGKNPVRIFIDKNLEVPLTAHIYNSEAPTVIFNTIKDKVEEGRTWVKINFETEVLGQISEKLYEMGIQTVLVEGGLYLLNDFIGRNGWDEALVFQNPDLTFGAGIRAPEFPLRNTFELVGNDKLYIHSQGMS